MKKLISLLLALALAVSCAAFGEVLTDEMKALTAEVKEKLGIEDIYSSFEVSSYDGIYYMYWYGDNGSCDVNVSKDGTIYSFWRWIRSEKPIGTGGVTARFPAMSAEEITAAADKFMAGLITEENWGVRLEEIRPSLSRNGGETTYVSGCLTLGGILTDITFTVGLDANSGIVTYFYRSDFGRTYRDTDTAHAAVTADEADALLRSADWLRPVYMVIGENETARLVYRRDYEGIKFVRADNGEVITGELTGIALTMNSDVYAEESAKAMGLTGYELEGIDVYKDALSLAEIEARIRGMEIFGIDESCKLETSSYFTANGAARARISFTDGNITLTFTADAVTGMPLSLYSWASAAYDYDEDADVCACEEYAVKALLACFPDEFPHFWLMSTDTSKGYKADYPLASFSYVRQQDGYLFESDTAWAQVDTSRGVVTGFSLSYDPEQEFAPVPETPIGTDAALDSFYSGTRMELMYLSVPVEGDLCDLTLVWRRAGNEDVYAVDAGTGEGYSAESDSAGPILYEDTSSMLYADEVELLGLYGIGLEGRRFTEGEYCTAEELAALILAADGISADEAAPRFESRYGITLPEGETITRAEAAKLLACAAGYKNALALSGIYSLPAADWESVDEEYKAGLAVSFALGLLEYDSDGNTSPDAPLLTAEAAHAVHALLSR